MCYIITYMYMTYNKEINIDDVSNTSIRSYTHNIPGCVAPHRRHLHLHPPCAARPQKTL